MAEEINTTSANDDSLKAKQEEEQRLNIVKRPHHSAFQLRDHRGRFMRRMSVEEKISKAIKEMPEDLPSDQSVGALIKTLRDTFKDLSQEEKRWAKWLIAAGIGVGALTLLRNRYEENGGDPIAGLGKLAGMGVGLAIDAFHSLFGGSEESQNQQPTDQKPDTKPATNNASASAVQATTDLKDDIQSKLQKAEQAKPGEKTLSAFDRVKDETKELLNSLLGIFRGPTPTDEVPEASNETPTPDIATTGAGGVATPSTVGGGVPSSGGSSSTLSSGSTGTPSSATSIDNYKTIKSAPVTADTGDKFGSMAPVTPHAYEKRKGVTGEFNYGIRGETGVDLSKGSVASQGRLVTVQLNTGKRVQVDKDVAAQFQGFANELEARGYKINSIGGYNNRMNVNNPSMPSVHALGRAIDINPGSNPNKGGTTDMPEGVEDLAHKYGISWGARFGDPMHFEAMGPDAARLYRKQLLQQGKITKSQFDALEKGDYSNVAPKAEAAPTKATEADVQATNVQQLKDITATGANPFFNPAIANQVQEAKPAPVSSVKEAEPAESPSAPTPPAPTQNTAPSQPEQPTVPNDGSFSDIGVYIGNGALNDVMSP